jgi:hypothetical protein
VGKFALSSLSKKPALFADLQALLGAKNSAREISWTICRTPVPPFVDIVLVDIVKAGQLARLKTVKRP